MTKFKIQNSKFKIQNSKFKIQNSKFKIQNSKFKIQNSKFKIQKILNTKKYKSLNEVDKLRKVKAKEAFMKNNYHQELQITNDLLDELYAEQAIKMMAMFNFLSNEDRNSLLKTE
ncbi:hypothetical protein [Acinetobacter johnsonii]|uniref:hypothetical protein n=1 Tax=Acinetobacter johnsonii TaxID=40214 RepID=UPI0024470FAF|nr:hypothetical protein [Acinetobacter johnsonii]MDH1706076.1 hypothetical protein [Acinetobacter johnsonii]